MTFPTYNIYTLNLYVLEVEWVCVSFSISIKKLASSTDYKLTFAGTPQQILCLFEQNI